MSTKKLDTTVKSTQEQLRSDHIGTLELLQHCTKENVKLKKELKALRAGALGKDIGNDQESSKHTAVVGTDLLDLVETNTKQADEIKLLKSRLNQAELDAMKSKQSQAVTQQAVSQGQIDKARRKEIEMEQAVFELEGHLQTAKAELKENKTLIDDLRILHGNLVQKFNDLEQNHVDVCASNEALASNSSSFHTQISTLRRELDQCQLEKKRLEACGDQRLIDTQKLLAHQTEQNSILKKELQAQAESAYQLQQMNVSLRAECESAFTSNQKLQSSILALNSTIEEQKLSIQDMQNAIDEGSGETFKFTAPIPQTPATTPIVDDERLNPDRESDSSFRFQEFLRLKRENKELKMRLADMGLSSGVAHQPELLRSSTNSLAKPAIGASGPLNSSPRGSTKRQSAAGGLTARAHSSASQKVI